jgi:hypothetical protein
MEGVLKTGKAVLLPGAIAALILYFSYHAIAGEQGLPGRAAVKRGRMVNRTFGAPEGQLHERHDASDFELRTQDKLNPST